MSEPVKVRVYAGVVDQGDRLSYSEVDKARERDMAYVVDSQTRLSVLPVSLDVQARQYCHFKSGVRQ